MRLTIGLAEWKKIFARAQDGDQEAFAQLVEGMGSGIKRFVRQRIRQLHMQRFLDEEDIYQSILYRFALAIMAGQLNLDSPEAALQLLLAMARNRLIDHARHLGPEREHRAELQPKQMSALGERQTEDLRAGLVFRELGGWIRQHVSDEEWRLYKRGARSDWMVLAREYSTSPDAMRMRYTRLLRRISHQIDDFVKQFPEAERVLAERGYGVRHRPA